MLNRAHPFGEGPSANFSETFTVTGPITVTGPNGGTAVVPNTSRQVTVNGRRLSRIRNNLGTDRILGSFAVHEYSYLTESRIGLALSVSRTR